MKSLSNQPFKGLNNLHHHIFFFLFLLPSICSKVYTKWTQQLQSSKLNRSLWEHCTLLAACCFTTVQQLRLMSVCCLCRVCVYLKYLYLCTRATEMELLVLFLFHMCVAAQDLTTFSYCTFTMFTLYSASWTRKIKPRRHR